METYLKDPSTIKFDAIAAFNPPKSDEEYEALLYSIKNGKQEDPILMRNNKCGDGFHRVKVAIKLGRQVLCTDIDSNMRDKDFIALCNRSTFTARNDSITQKAIKAYKLTKDYSYTDAEAIKLTGLKKGSKGIGYARTISESNYNKKHNILDKLLAGKTVNINGTFTKSIEVCKRLIATYEEEQLDSIKSTVTIPTVDYNEYLDTEKAKSEFWGRFGKNSSITIDDKLFICALLNASFTKLSPILTQTTKPN